MKKIYIAKRIATMSNDQTILAISPDMSVQEIHDIYISHSIPRKAYIYNGHWILRSPLSESHFTENRLPENMRPLDIWDMVKEKIDTSDIVVGIINSKAYGTIAELGYASSKGTIAVYVLPELGMAESELQDLWFIFQIAQSTKHLWEDTDIQMLDEFKEFKIYSIQDYERYLANIVPNFMKRN
jgi:nucleoside 2-deoxyribosyltransferase